MAFLYQGAKLEETFRNIAIVFFLPFSKTISPLGFEADISFTIGEDCIQLLYVEKTAKPEADVDGVLAAYCARLQQRVAALEQQHQGPHGDEEEVVQLRNHLIIPLFSLDLHMSNFWSSI
jgi:hypothetical protein